MTGILECYFIQFSLFAFTLIRNIKKGEKTMSKQPSIGKPSLRKLRAYSVDPSLTSEMETATLNCVEVEIPWEKISEDIAKKMNSLGIPESKFGPAPGPIGEYIEIIDYDPTINVLYDPIDLNHPFLLSQNGYAPSDGNPQFHQQMIYAVVSKTIKIFEKALGRVILWSSGTPDNQDQYVKRLRIYPHAFIAPNAYYSQDRKAILFGYFYADATPSGKHFPGGIVFSCLSQDIIVHELSHAILDGMHRRYIENSNPDTLAFHEAFADVIAIFQHFSFSEIVKHEIAKTRGNLGDKNLLANLAKEFGQSIGRSESLRSAIGEDKADPTKLSKTFEVHARGAVLVAAIFEAFLSIYQTRTADLMRLATTGSRKLNDCYLSTELIDRLSQEASKAASHILNICIRAIDYLPPVDITFGDYLRAIITADTDLVPNDTKNYRVAFIEAFRRHGIYPKDVRSLSQESLLWDGPAKEQTSAEGFLNFVEQLKTLVSGWDLTIDRENLFNEMVAAQGKTHDIIKETWSYKRKYLKGLEINLEQEDVFEIHSIRPIRRVGPDGQVLTDLLIEITQKRPGYFDKAFGPIHDRTSEPDFWFRGGCTIIIDMKTFQLRYCIYKDIKNTSRYNQQQEYMKKGNLYLTNRSAYFMSSNNLEGDDLFLKLANLTEREAD